MSDLQGDIISLPQAAKNHVIQLQANINLANQVFTNYIQGCFDSLRDGDDGSDWEFELEKMCFKKTVKREVTHA